jgi:hypothetical protein
LCPQLKQNFAPGGKAVAHFGQEIVNDAPQFMQNLAPSGFELWQLEQSIEPHAVTQCEFED